MTTTAQSQARVFNPNAFQSADDQAEQSSAQQSQNEQKEYPTTGNSARDSVRKMLYELFQSGDQDEKECKDPKSRQYREKTRAVQIKLKGPRFEQSRKDLRTGAVDAQTLIRDDFIQGKSVQVSGQNTLPQRQQQPLPNGNPSMRMNAPGGAPSFRPPGPAGALGGIRPRMMPPAGMGFRPPLGGGGAPGFRPLMPQPTQNSSQQLQHTASQSSLKQNVITNEDHSDNRKVEEVNNLNQQQELERPQEPHANLPLPVDQRAHQMASQLSQQEGDERVIENNSSSEQQQQQPLQISPQSQTQQQMRQQQTAPSSQRQSSNRLEQLNQNKHEQSIRASPMMGVSQSQKSLNSQHPTALDQEEDKTNAGGLKSPHQMEDHEEDQTHNNHLNNQQITSSNDKMKKDQNMIDLSQDRALGIDDSIISNEKKPTKKKKKKKAAAKKALKEDEQFNENVPQQLQQNQASNIPEENINEVAHSDHQLNQSTSDQKTSQHEQISLNNQEDKPQRKQSFEESHNIPHTHQQNNDEDLIVVPRAHLSSNYQFLDQSSSVIIQQDRDESIHDISLKQQQNSNNQNIILEEDVAPLDLSILPNQQSDERSDLIMPNEITIDAAHEVRQNELSHKSASQEEEEHKTPQNHQFNSHRSKQPSIDFTNQQMNNKGANIAVSSKQEKQLSKNQSVKSLAAQSSSTAQHQPTNSAVAIMSMMNQNSSSAGAAAMVDQDNLKRLQDALSYKRQQKKELNEKIVHLENDIHLQQRKAGMLMDENKSIREELRVRDRELKSLQNTQNERQNQLQVQNKKLESQLRERQAEIDQVKRELQRQREEKQQYKEKVQSITEESLAQRQLLEALLRNLESRVSNSSAVSSAGNGSGNNQQIQVPASSSVMSVPSGNQADQVEQLQRELREMKNQYEQKMRELNEELNNRTRMLQRSERQNITLQERNNQLQELLSQVELQQLSTVAGSGSNQRDSTSLLNRRQGGGSINDDDNQHNHRAYEEEGTGGDGGYNQSSQSNVRNQNDYLFPDEGGNAAVISGLSENYDIDSNQNVYQDGGSTTQRLQRANQNYQIEAVSGGHPQYEDEPDQEEDIEDEEDEDYDDDEGDMAINDDDDEDEEGNQYDDTNGGTQGIASSLAQRDNQATGHGGSHYGSGGSSGLPNYQGDNNEGYAGGQQTFPPRQRKQGQRRRGNRQQNQQHTTATGQSAISIQNPRQRNSRGRQQRSNQQTIQQQQQQLQVISQNSQQHSEIHPSHAPSSAPSSQIRQNQAQQHQQQQNSQDYFQNYGDSSSIFMMNNAQNNRDQSSSSVINVPPAHNQFSQVLREGGPAAGSGVVLTAGRQNAVDSMMSAESGSTATAFFDKNQFHRGHNVPQTRQQNQPSSLQSVQQNQLQFQTGSNNQNNQQQLQQQPQQQQQTSNFQQVPSDLFNDNDVYTAAVGAPTSRAAAHPRQSSRQQPSNQNQNATSSTSSAYGAGVGGVYQFAEEVKQSSGEIPVYYQNMQQNANQSQIGNSSLSNNNPSSSSIRQQQVSVHHNQYVGGSGEQEEDSSSGFYSGSGVGNLMHHQQQQLNYQNHGSAGGGPSSAFESTRRNQSQIQQQQQHHIRQGMMQQQQQQQHSLQDQSNTPTRNDSRKTSGANTPNKDGADTPTTKAYRGQQQQNSYVHNLTSNQLFFSNQDDGDSAQLFGGSSNLSSTPQQNQHHLLHHQQQQQIHPHHQQNALHHQQQPQQFGRELEVINPNMFE